MSMTGSTPAASSANKTGIFSDVSGKKVLTALQQLERNLNAFTVPPLPSSSSTTSATASAHTSPGNADYAAESVVERVVAMKSGSFIEPKKEFSHEDVYDDGEEEEGDPYKLAESETPEKHKELEEENGDELYGAKEEEEDEYLEQEGEEVGAEEDILSVEGVIEEDEWRQGDYDTGITIVSISEADFNAMQQQSLSYAHKLADLEQSMLTWHSTSSQGERSFGVEEGDGYMGHDNNNNDSSLEEAGLGQDILEAEQLLLSELNGKDSVAPLEDKEEESEQLVKPVNRYSSIEASRRFSDIIGQNTIHGIDGSDYTYFDLRVVFGKEPMGLQPKEDFKGFCGQVVAGRYQLIKELGTGAFSTAFHAVDSQNMDETGAYSLVCLKAINKAKDSMDQGLEEIKILQYINSKGDADHYHFLSLVDFFYCEDALFIVTDLLKEDLYVFSRELRQEGQPNYFTLPRVKRVARQLLETLQFLARIGIAHCDIKPENIAIKSYSKCDVKLIDFGSSTHEHTDYVDYVQSRSYRAPEVFLGHKYDCRIDIWSLGAVLAELFSGYVLFQSNSQTAWLGKIAGVVGPFSEAFLAEGKNSSLHFTHSGVLFEQQEDSSYHLVYSKKTTLAQRMHLTKEIEANPEGDEALFIDFLRTLLQINWRERPTATQALTHPWLVGALENDVTYDPL